ncbi:PREDICTED: protein FAM210A [Cyprinodon variegatus]|uniref:Family with sequence similarity 210 member A n=1 Tax=Cyprinodon variegatus TaxID=28743 RepID=A0A3Q2CMM7_CYPVA|nr:PREDICTED: protein FAM210A [Cyprinodon variegatus]XP_015238554.1 PREDICTED: protein FAM210A [Cyprinodon variegatus]
MMQHILTHGTLWRMVAVRSCSVGAAVLEHQLAPRFCILRLSLLQPVGQRWISASASCKVADQPKESPRDDRVYPASTTPSPNTSKEEAECVDVDPLQDKSISLFQRFKKTFKQYGKVMIPVHLATSSVWFGTFYYAAMHGVNVVPFLEMIGLPESLVGLLRDSSSGYALTAYAMYKVV